MLHNIAARKAYEESKEAIVTFVKRNSLKREPETMAFLADVINAAFGAGSCNAGFASLSFDKSSKDGKAAENWYYAQVNFNLPKGKGRGKSKGATAITVTPAVKAALKVYAALTAAERKAFNSMKADIK